MLEFARALSLSDEKFFGGWIMAEACVSVLGAAARLENRIVFARKRLACLEVVGFGADGKVAKRLTVKLVLPVPVLKEGKPRQAAPDSLRQGEPVARRAFTREEVCEYVSFTGDMNVIHALERPIVPGLLLIAWLQQARGLEAFELRTSFRSPVYAGEEVCVYLSRGRLCGYVGDRLAFTSV